MNRTIFALVPALLFALAGCATETADNSSADEAALETASPSSFLCADAWNSTDAAIPSTGSGVVAATRAGGHADFDRFVIEFEGAGVPEWGVWRQDSAMFHTDGAGHEVPLAGTAGLGVYVRTSMYYGGWSSPETGTPFTGATRFRPNGTSVITEAALLGDFEQVHTWGIGLNKAACYRVTQLTNPPRLVIDVAR